MKITWNASKNQKNIRERDLPFEMIYGFDWETAVYNEDTRFDYPEVRISAYGFIDARLYHVVFTETNNGIHVISFRKANARERKCYDAQAG